MGPGLGILRHLQIGPGNRPRALRPICHAARELRRGAHVPLLGSARDPGAGSGHAASGSRRFLWTLRADGGGSRGSEIRATGDGSRIPAIRKRPEAADGRGGVTGGASRLATNPSVIVWQAGFSYRMAPKAKRPPHTQPARNAAADRGTAPPAKTGRPPESVIPGVPAPRCAHAEPAPPPSPPLAPD